MFELNEEMLMAYADGELDPQVMAQVKAALDDDPTAQEKVRRYQRSTQLLQQAYDAPMHEELPERLLRAAGVETSREKAPDDADDKVVSIAAWTAQRMGPSLRGAALPLAASLALVIGTAVGYKVHPSPESTPMTAALTGQIDPANQLHQVLETARSGASAVWTQGETEGRAVAQLTFKAEDGRFCRQYQVSFSGPERTQATSGVACRQDDGGWRSEIAVSAPVQSGEGGSDAYVAATGGGDKALDAFLDRVMAEPALGNEEEAQAIGANWQ